MGKGEAPTALDYYVMQQNARKKNFTKAERQAYKEAYTQAYTNHLKRKDFESFCKKRDNSRFDSDRPHLAEFDEW